MKILRKLWNRFLYDKSRLIDWIYEKVTYKPHVMDALCTIDYIVQHRCSFARFGDGEICYMFGHSLRFQAYDRRLAEKLMQVIVDKNILIGIPDAFENLDRYLPIEKRFWKNHFFTYRRRWMQYLSIETLYGSTFVSRFYSMFEDKTKAEPIVKALRKLFAHREIITIEGKYSRLGVGNDLFQNAQTLRRILAPAENAFSVYDKILDTIRELKIPNDTLFILALGPCATALTAELHTMGYQALDLGHIDLEYEWYRQNASEKLPIRGRYNNEACIQGLCSTPVTGSLTDSENTAYTQEILVDLSTPETSYRKKTKPLRLYFTDFEKGHLLCTNPVYRYLSQHYNISMDKDHPDIVFYSCFGLEHRQYPQATRVFMCGENIVPDFNVCDYSISQLHFDFDGRNLWYPFAYWYIPEKIELPEITEKHAKRLFCSFIANNTQHGSGAIHRLNFSKILSERKLVHCPGKANHNIDCPELVSGLAGDWMRTKRDYMRNYKFNIAFENSYGCGYITEKLTDAYISDTVPIYWGSRSYIPNFLRTGMINANEWENLNELADYIMQLDQDDERYFELLRCNPYRMHAMTHTQDELHHFLDQIIANRTKTIDKIDYYRFAESSSRHKHPSYLLHFKRALHRITHF